MNLTNFVDPSTNSEKEIIDEYINVNKKIMVINTKKCNIGILIDTRSSMHLFD